MHNCVGPDYIIQNGERDLKNSRTSSVKEMAMILQGRHNEQDGVVNHQPHDCIVNCLFRRRSKKASKFPSMALCGGWWIPGKRAIDAEIFSFDDVTMRRQATKSVIQLIKYTEHRLICWWFEIPWRLRLYVVTVFITLLCIRDVLRCYRSGNRNEKHCATAQPGAYNKTKGQTVRCRWKNGQIGPMVKKHSAAYPGCWGMECTLSI